MVQKLSYTANSITLGTGTSRVILGADSGNLIVKDSDANTSIVEPGIGVQGQSGVSTYANSSVLPFSPISPAGSLAYTTATGTLYMSNGSGWYKISMVNTTPSITLSSTTATPTATNLTVDLTYTVTEPEGTPTTVTFANSGIATTGNVAITHTASNNHVRLVFDGTTKYEGDATVTLSVTDGVNTGTGTITITTAYYSGKNTAETAILLKAKTGVLTTAQKSIAFNGSSQYLTLPNSDVALGTGDFTIESWVYLRSRATNHNVVWNNYNSYASGAIALFAGHPNHTTSYTIAHHGLTFPSVNGGTLNYNQWDHLAVVRNGTTITMYQNGTSIGSFSSSTNLAGVGTNFHIANGGDVISTGYNHADYSNFRIVVGTAVYTGNFTPPSGVLTKTGGTYPSTNNVNTSITASHTKLLTLQGAITDSSDNSVTITNNGSVSTTPSTNSPYFYGDNNNWFDKSSSGHILTAYGDLEQLAFSPYRNNGYSVYFDGSGDYLRDDTIADINDTGGKCDNFTLEMWIYNEDDPTDSDYFVGSNNLANGANDFIFGTNRTYWNASQVGSDYGATYGKQYEWQHYVIMHETDGASNADVITLWIDGRRVFRDTGNTRISFNNNGWAFGTEADAANMGSLGNYFNGYMYDVKFTKAALYTSTNQFIPVPTAKSTPHESANIFHGFQKPHLDFRFRNPGTIGGTAGCHPFTPFDRDDKYTTATDGGSVRLRPQGGNDYFTVASSSDFAFGTGDFTVEAWVFPEAMSVHQMIMDTCTPGATGSTAGRLALYLNPNKMAYYKPGTGTTNQSNSATMVPFSWHHCAWVRSSGTMKMYLDGNEVYSGAETYNFSLQTLTLGKDAASGGAGQARAYWSDLRIVKGTAVYTSAFTPPTEPLTAISGTVLHLPFTDFKIFDASQTLLAKSDVSVDRLAIVGDTASSSAQQHFSEATVYFDGTGDYIDTPNPIISTEDHTHEAWVYPTGGDATYKGFFASAHPSSGAGISVAKDKAIGPQGGSSDLITFNPVVPDNEWSHVVLQRQDGVHYLYRNGVLQGTSTTSIDITNTNLRLASRYADNTNRMFAGYMHDFRVSKGLARYPFVPEFIQLTTTNSTDPATTVTGSNVRVVGVYNSSNASTMSGTAASDITVALGSGTSVSTFAPYTGGGSIYMDGGAGPTTYASFTTSAQDGLFTFASSDDFGIEYYIYHDEVVASGTSHRHINTAVSGGLGFFKAGSGDPGGSNRFTVRRRGVGNDLSIPNYNTLFPPFKWHHVCVQRVSGTLTVFVNGKPVGSATGNTRTYPTGVVGFGSPDTTSDNFQGYFSNLRVVKGQGIYSANFTPSTSAFE